MALKEVQLNKRERKELIEILLIVASILTAFNISNMPEGIIGLLTFFLTFFFFLSIAYYIFIHQKWGKITRLQFISMSIISIATSVSFVGTITIFFLISLLKIYPEVRGPVFIFLAGIYYLVFTYLIYKALMPFRIKEGRFTSSPS